MEIQRGLIAVVTKFRETNYEKINLFSDGIHIDTGQIRLQLKAKAQRLETTHLKPLEVWSSAKPQGLGADAASEPERDNLFDLIAKKRRAHENTTNYWELYAGVAACHCG